MMTQCSLALLTRIAAQILREETQTVSGVQLLVGSILRGDLQARGREVQRTDVRAETELETSGDRIGRMMM
jgi:hypothetical protein